MTPKPTLRAEPAKVVVICPTLTTMSTTHARFGTGVIRLEGEAAKGSNLVLAGRVARLSTKVAP